MADSYGKKILSKKQVLLIMAAVLGVVALVIMFFSLKLIKTSQTPEMTGQLDIPMLFNGETAAFLTETKVIDYKPLPDVSKEYQILKGECISGSPYFNREDVFTCTIDEPATKFEACFRLEKKDTLFCGVDPLDEQSGLIIESINPLKTLEVADDLKLGLIQLENGIICRPLGDIELIVEGKKANYQCGENQVLLGEILKEVIWKADLATIKQDLLSHEWSIEMSEQIRIATILQ